MPPLRVRLVDVEHTQDYGWRVVAIEVEEFQRHLVAIREEATVEAYMTAIRHHFVPWLNSRTVDRYTPSLLQDFVDHLCSKGLMPSTAQLYYTAARMFVTWLKKKGEDVPEQMSVELPRINESAPKVINPDDLREFMERAREKAEPYATCLMMLPLTGLRISEAVGLELGNVLVTTGGYTFLVKDTKGKRDRYVPLLSSGTPLFRHYLIHVRRTLPGAKWVFPSPKSSKKGMMPIHPRVVQDIMKDIRDAHGLNFTPHTLRHVYATVLHRNGISDIQKAKLLGHRSINTTQRYVHLDPNDLHSDIANVETPWADSTRPAVTQEGDDDEPADE